MMFEGIDITTLLCYNFWDTYCFFIPTIGGECDEQNKKFITVTCSKSLGLRRLMGRTRKLFLHEEREYYKAIS